MNTSDNTDKVLPALLSAAADFKAVKLDATNDHYRSKYATLPAYLDAVSPALRARGLLLTQGTRIADTGTVVLTRITHAETGQWVGSEYPVHPVKPDPQAEGSALTYARRYALAALLGLAADDDDGEAARKGKAPEKEPVTPITPTGGVFDALSPEEKARAETLIADVLDYCAQGDYAGAWEYKDRQHVLKPISSDLWVAVWSKLDSKVRTPLNKARKEAA